MDNNYHTDAMDQEKYFICIESLKNFVDTLIKEVTKLDKKFDTNNNDH